jgi:adenylylsulfate kinase
VEVRARALFVSGTIAAGKTTIAEAAAGVLADAGVPHGLIDLDWLCQAYPAPPEDPFHNALGFENLAAVWPHYAARGIRSLVVARVIESRRWRDRCESSLAGVEITVVRLVASRSTRHERIVQREVDPLWRDRFLSRTGELEEILDRDDVADFRLDNDGRPPRAVATQMLKKAGWIEREE